MIKSGVWILLAALILALGLTVDVNAAPAQSDDLSHAPSLYDTLDQLDCSGVSRICQETIPGLFVAGYPDSLLNLVYYWEDICGRAEPITRTLILGAIWDGAFSENLYDDEIIDFLIWYGDKARHRYPHPGDEVDPGQASGGVASAADFTPARDLFDDFTTDLADQLLPHTEPGSLEQFFCLFYSGESGAAWRLLEGDALKGSYLNRLYDWELERISIEREPVNYALYGGYWMPSGNLELAGDHFLVGGLIEKRPGPLLGRLTMDMLIGRSKYPYDVNQDGVTGRSNRFNVVCLGVEAGFSPLKRGAYSLDLYGGVGLEALWPFLDESKSDDQLEVVLVDVKGLVGVGYSISMGSYRKWFAGVDVRREWVGNRNDGGTPLDGRAWSVRLSFGFNRNHDLDRRLHGLGR